MMEIKADISGSNNISYDKIRDTKGSLSRSRQITADEKDKLSDARNILDVTGSSRLRIGAGIIDDQVKKVNARIKNIERVSASIDYAEKRFQ